MRTPRELAFRARQEMTNLQLWLFPPTTQTEPATPFEHLPHPESVVERLRGTRFESNIVRLADSIREHHFPMAEGNVSTGTHIEWRRDYGTGVLSGPRYFRAIPYLDATRVGNSRAVWELNRHQHLIVLAQAWLFTRRDEYIVEIESQLTSWSRDNPYMRGINWVSALEVAFRALSWLWTYHLVGSSLALATRRTLTSGLYHHGCYLEHNLSVYASPNTHLLGEAVALHALGVLIPDFDRSARWRRRGAEITAQQIDVQINEDGAHFEQSSYYHLYALDMFVFHQLLENTSHSYRETLRRMVDYLDALMGRTRTMPLIGDDDGGRLFHPYGQCDRFARATIATCSKLLRSPKWEYEGEDLHEQAVWWLGADVLDETRPVAQEKKSCLFRTAGVASMHAPQLEVLVDAGPFGRGTGGHSHSDTLSVIARGGGEELLIDSGTFTYIADEAAREWFRSSAAHNTVRIDDRDQGRSGGPFRWIEKPRVEILGWDSNAQVDALHAACDYGGNPSLTHRRQVMLLKGVAGAVDAAVLVVCDIIEGEGGEHLIEQYWRPGASFEIETATHVRLGNAATLVTSEPNHFECANGWRSRRFGAKAPAPSLVVRQKTALPCVIWTALTVGCSTRSIQLVTDREGRQAMLTVGGALKVDFRAGDISSVPRVLNDK